MAPKNITLKRTLFFALQLLEENSERDKSTVADDVLYCVLYVLRRLYIPGRSEGDSMEPLLCATLPRHAGVSE